MELTLTEEDIADDRSTLVFEGDRIVGVAQVSNGEGGCDLEKLFVAPSEMGKGTGRALFE